MNPMDIFKIKGLWDRFKSNHPKFPLFLSAVSHNTIREGAIIEIKVTTPEGENYTTNLRITASDMEILDEARQLGSNFRG